MSVEVGRAILGVVQFGVGFALFGWPERMNSLSLSRAVRTGKLGRQTLIAQRLLGVAFMAIGAAIIYSALSPAGLPTEGTKPRDLALLAASLVWLVIGVAMAIWPARARTLTNPDWQRYEGVSLAANSLFSYRITGLGFALIAIVAIFFLVDRIQ